MSGSGFALSPTRRSSYVRLSKWTLHFGQMKLRRGPRLGSNLSEYFPIDAEISSVILPNTLRNCESVHSTGVGMR